VQPWNCIAILTAWRLADLPGASGGSSERRVPARLNTFRAGKIWNEQCGKPSRPTYRLAIK